jgi:CrcB protein
VIYVWNGTAGILGTWLRYGLGLWAQSWAPRTLFPLGTLTVNLIGCFVLGWFSQWVLDKTRVSPQLRSGISTGLLGSFTTFSAFSVETVQLFRHGLWGVGAVYAGISLIGGLGLVWLGTWAAGGRKGRTPND